LGNLLIAIALAIAALTILDIVLSDDQKRIISDAFIRAWNFIDDVKARFAKALHWLRRKHAEFYIAAIPTFLLLSSYVSLNIRQQIPIAVIIGGAACVGTSRFLINSRTFVSFMLRSIALLLLTCLVALLYGLIVSHVYGEFNDIRRVFIELFAVMFVFVGVLWSLSVSALPLMMIYAISFVLWVLERTLRGISQYPKGPLFALAALLTGIGLALKLIS